MGRPSPEIVGCPSCGARNFAIDDSCVGCGSVLEIVILPRPTVRHIRLGSIMGIIAFTAMCFVPMRHAPWLSLFLGAYLLPAAVRGMIVLERRRLESRVTRADAAFAILINSFFLCAAIVTSAAFVLVATTFTIGSLTIHSHSGPFEPGAITSYSIGMVAGVVTIYVVGKRLWPERD